MVTSKKIWLHPNRSSSWYRFIHKLEAWNPYQVMLPLHRTEPSTGSSSAYGTRPLSPSVVLIRSVHVQIRNNVCLHSYLDKLSVH
ncbi:unnamed protein product [Brassica oleracea]